MLYTGGASAAGPSCQALDTFDGDSDYEIPHRVDTTARALRREDGVARFHIRPGMHADVRDQMVGSERAEIARPLGDAVWVRQRFRVRVDAGFVASRRTLIAQIKQRVGVPAIAVYLDGQGRAKCRDFRGGPGHGEVRQVTVDTLASAGVSLTDGAWHEVVMEYVRSRTQGYCRVSVDGRDVVELAGHDSDPKSVELAARVGIYRDAVPYDQVVYFDDWRVEAAPSVPPASGRVPER